MTPRNVFDLEGRVAIVTGGTRGIGRAIALGLVQAGATVVAAARTESACDSLVVEINEHRGTGTAIPTDVTQSGDRERLVETAVARYGQLDVLINNAGILKPHATDRVTEVELDSILSVNLKAPVFLSQLAVPHLAAGEGGSIINVSALGAFQPMSGIGAYCAVKAAMVNWTMTMAKEWTPRGVRVNALVPGPVATEMILPKDPADRSAFIREMSGNTLVGRLAEPEDLVGAAIFLASAAATFMTGRCLFLDGGMMA